MAAFVLPGLASAVRAGLVKIGSGLSVAADGTISAAIATLQTAGILRLSGINVRDNGLVGDGLTVSDGAMTSASAVLTSASGKFTSAHVGKRITVRGAGAAGATLATTIASYQSATQVTLSASASTTVSGAVVYWGTGDGAALQALLTSLAGTGAQLVVPAGIYMIDAGSTNGSSIPVGVSWPSGVSMASLGRGVVTFVLCGTAQCTLFSSATLRGVGLSGITFDANGLGSNVLFVGPSNSDVSVRSCTFKNAVQNSTVNSLGWSIAIGSVSGAATTIVAFVDNVVGPNPAGHYESAIFLNTQGLQIVHNTFTGNTTANYGTGLAVYAYCRNVTITGNTFDTNSIDCYLQQSDTITFTANTFLRSASGVSLDIYSCRNVSVGPTTFKATATGCVGIRFFDQYDQGLTAFNGNASLYAFSKDVSIGPCTFQGYYTSVQCYAPVMTSNQVAVNLLQDIDIHDCLFDNDQSYSVLYGVQVGCAYTQNMQRIKVRNCHHAGGNYSGGAGVLVQGNPGMTATTTTQAITASASKQTITVASTTNVVAGMWLHIDDGTHGTAEEVYVYAVPVSGQITTIFAQSHTTGAAVANSTTLVNSGLTDIPIDRYKIQPSSSGNSSGVILWNAPRASNVDLWGCDLTNAGTGTGGKVVLIGTGTYRSARFNLGLNPLKSLLTNSTAVCSPAMSGPGQPTSGTTYTNVSGVDIDLYPTTPGGITGVTLDGVTLGSSLTMNAPLRWLAGSTLAITWTTTQPVLAAYGN